MLIPAGWTRRGGVWRARRDKKLNWQVFIDSKTYNIGGPAGARKVIWEVMQEHSGWLETCEIKALVRQRQLDHGRSPDGSYVVGQAVYGLERTGWIEREEIAPNRYRFRIRREIGGWIAEYSLISVTD